MTSGKLNGADDFEKLKDLASRPYKAQAVWFLNAYWDDFGSKESELFWGYADKIASLDLQKGKEGNEVDEFIMHKFLESFKETLTVREMRDTLKETGAIKTTPKLIPLVHYLIFKYKIDWKQLVNASQGGNQKEIEEAQRLLDEVNTAFKVANEKAEIAKAALKEAESREATAKKEEATAKAREAEAKATEETSKQREAAATQKDIEAKAAQEELQAALADLKAQEDARNKRTEELTKGSEDESTGVVTRNKLKAELAQHLAADPLPLRKAKITCEAAVKKADKAALAATTARTDAEAASVAAQKAAQEATHARSAAEQSAREAEKAKADAAVAKENADAAVDDAQKKVEVAEAYLNEVKSRPGSAHGAIWWMERELHEQKKYMPEKKGGIKKA